MANGLDRDPGQVLKESYDKDLERIKVEALVSDGVDALIINPDGSINVNATVSASAPPVGAATEAKQDVGNASLASIDSKLTNPLPVSTASLPLPAGAATETTLSAFKTANHTDLGTLNTTLGSPMQNSGGSVTANLGSLNGAATAANQTTGNASLSSIDGKMNSLGQKTMANSMPVTIASDQSTFPVTVTQQGAVLSTVNSTTTPLAGNEQV